jgi:hypothetical protein
MVASRDVSASTACSLNMLRKANRHISNLWIEFRRRKVLAGTMKQVGFGLWMYQTWVIDLGCGSGLKESRAHLLCSRNDPILRINCVFSQILLRISRLSELDLDGRVYAWLHQSSLSSCLRKLKTNHKESVTRTWVVSRFEDKDQSATISDGRWKSLVSLWDVVEN